jgi:hypothetical protein
VRVFGGVRTLFRVTRYLFDTILDVYSTRFAMRLRELGVTPGQIVAVLTEFSFEYFVAIFGIIKAGGVWLPIDPQAPVDRSNITFAKNDVQVLVHLKHQSTKKFELQGTSLFSTYLRLPTGLCYINRIILSSFRIIEAPRGYATSTVFILSFYRMTEAQRPRP